MSGAQAWGMRAGLDLPAVCVETVVAVVEDQATGDMYIVATGPVPPWLDPTIAALQKLTALGANWDSYGAVPIDRKNVIRALELLGDVMHFDTLPPQVVPTSGGGIQLEWHVNGVNLEIEIEEASRIHAYYELVEEEEEWEGDVSSNRGALSKPMSRLSSRR